MLPLLYWKRMFLFSQTWKRLGLCKVELLPDERTMEQVVLIWRPLLQAEAC